MMVRDWLLRARALLSPRRAERDLNDELSFHLDRETQKLIEQGRSPEDARAMAQARFGSTTVAADECRDQRGTATVDNTIRDLTYAVRTIARAPLASFTIVATVGLGLGLVTVLFSVLNIFLFRVDHVPDINEMFAVERPRDANDEWQQFTRPQFDAMMRETSVFAGMYMELGDVDSRVDGRMMAITLLGGNAFQVLGVRAAMGRTLLASDDDRSAPQPVVVLSDKGWERRFGRDPNVVGRQIIVNGAPHEVVGVMPASFRGLNVGAPDLWAPLSSLAEFRPIHRGREDQAGIAIVGRLKPGLSAAAARAQLDAWDAQRSGATTRRDARIVLTPRRGTVPQPLEAMVLFAPLFFAFGLILMIGCANVANLLLARGVSRQREIGIRLSLGASRPRIVRQLLTESLLLALAAAAVGFVVSRVAIEGTLAAVLPTIPPDLGDISIMGFKADWRVGVFLIAGALVSTIFFALMPALHATRIDPVRTMRGELIKDAKPGRARTVLISLQVAASALLLICSAVFLRSALASATVDPGMRTADTVIVEIVNEPKRAAMIQSLASDPRIAMMAATWPDLLSLPRAAIVETPALKTTAAYKMVGPEYFAVLDIPIVRGRTFADHERAAPVVVLSETMARTLFPKSDAIGQVMQMEADPDSPTRRDDEPMLSSRSFTVVGISRDVAGFRITDTNDPGIFVPASTETPKTSVIVRVNGDPELARQHLLERLTIIDPNMGQILTMRTMARMERYFLNLAFWTTLVLGTLALTLTVSGLFSVLSYLVEQRTREIGVRMALGATSRHVTRLVLSQTAKPVGFGLFAGTGLAFALAILLIATPTAGVIGEVVHVTDPLAYAASIILIVAVCLLAAAVPAMRASRLDPMTTLRQE
ncbi:MAG: ABC transporter permease [Cyanobacteria bacterium]|nr:ABC transporter permease [Cyanobacteriota bacterium]